MNLVSILEAGRRDFLDATADISSKQASARPAPGCWTVLECIEHVVIVEDRYLGWISNGTSITPQRNPDKELRLFTTIRSRLTKVEASEVVWPVGRFNLLAVALAEFTAVRDRSVQLVEERGESLYSIGARHPYFGELNGVELIQLIDGHARRHADQIREIRE
jgi:hypothetical protein